MDHPPRSPVLYALFQRAGTSQLYGKGQTIDMTELSNGLAYVVKGYVKRYMIRNDGMLSIQIVYGPQDVFSLTRVYQLLLGQSLYDGGEQFYYGAMSGVEILSLRADTLASAIEETPLLYKGLFSEAGRHLHACVSNLENMAMDNTLQRVAHQLLFLAKKFGGPTSGGTSIQVPLTHQDIADILGVTRETVTRAITTLRKQRLIQTGESIVVCDQERLAAAAYRGEM